MTDQDQVALLVARAQAGDDAAFADLVRSHQDRAVAYATAILGDYHLAQDAAQEAFADAYRLLRSLRVPAAFGSWLRTIVFKHCDRSTRGRRLTMSGLESAIDVASPGPSPLEVLEASETLTALRARVAPPDGDPQSARRSTDVRAVHDVRNVARARRMRDGSSPARRDSIAGRT